MRYSRQAVIAGLAIMAGWWSGCGAAPATPPRVAGPPAAPAPAAGAPARPAAAVVAPRVAPFSPPVIAGFAPKEAPSSYGPETLFEYINGAADSFLAFDFQELTAFSYQHPSKAEVSVEVYRHRDAERAFGVYAMERPVGTRPLPVGIEGYAGRDYLQFVRGPYYVKLALANGKDFALLRAVADGVAGALSGTREPPPVFTCFPAASGRVPRAEKLAARDFLGRGFLHDAVTVPYELGGARFRLFAIRGRDGADARDMIARYLRVTGTPAARPGAAGATTVTDPVNGRVVLRWQGRWVWGAVDAPPPASAALLDQLGAALARQQP